MSDVFKLNDRSYNSKNNSDFQRRNIKMVLHESETLSSLGPQIWDLIPTETYHYLASLKKDKDFLNDS